MQQVGTKSELGLTEEEQAKFVGFEKVVNEYKNEPGAVMMLLSQAQQTFGYLPKQVQEYVAQKLNKTLSEIYGVATFYTFFTLFPKGRHTVRVCLGTACYVKGGKKILTALQHELGISVRETTSERRFSLDVNRCMGACALAPVVMIDSDIYARMSANRMPEVLARYK